jgi:hypothetical protein
VEKIFYRYQIWIEKQNRMEKFICTIASKKKSKRGIETPKEEIE